MDISIVSPVYNAEKILPELVQQIENAVKPLGLNYEIILVEDAGPDDSWAVIKSIAQANQNVKGIKFTRNFGQHYAITAGLAESIGDAVVIMDCDLQDNPEYIPQMLHKLKEGYDIIFTKKQSRKHSFFKNASAKIFFKIFNYLSDNQNASENAGNYTMLSRKTVDQFNKIQDKRRHYLMILRWMGFKSASVNIEHRKRHSGESSYNLSKLINHAIDGITSQSDKVLRISIKIGFAFFLLSIIVSIMVAIRYFLYGAFYGWTSLFIIVLLSTGLILISSGVIGIYVGRIFEQVKDRPLYIIDERLNFKS